MKTHWTLSSKWDPNDNNICEQIYLKIGRESNANRRGETPSNYWCGSCTRCQRFFAARRGWWSPGGLRMKNLFEEGLCGDMRALRIRASKGRTSMSKWTEKDTNKHKIRAKMVPKWKPKRHKNHKREPLRTRCEKGAKKGAPLARNGSHCWSIVD